MYRSDLYIQPYLSIVTTTQVINCINVARAANDRTTLTKDSSLSPTLMTVQQDYIELYCGVLCGMSKLIWHFALQHSSIITQLDKKHTHFTSV